MAKYETYKDSGIEWIGDIPEHWEVKRLKYIGESIIGITYSPKDLVQENGTLVLRSSNIQNGKLSLKDTVHINKEIPDKLTTRIGDILICSRNGSRRLIGKNITINEKTEGETFGAFMTVFRTEQYEFISKYFNSQVFSGQSGLFLTSTINQLTVNTLNNFFTALPPKKEQIKIANYLNKKSKKIDKLISQKKKLIELYELEKESIINQAVTKGINPEINLKDSGVANLGGIPEHWDITRMANIGKFSKGKGVSKSQITSQGLPVILYGDIYTKYDHVTNDLERKTSKDTSENSIQIFNNDLLFTASGETKEDIGKCVLFNRNYEAFAGGDVIIFRQNKNNSSFLTYTFNSFFFKKQKAKLSKGEIVVHIYQSQLRDIYFPLPPNDEQVEIANYLEKELIKIKAKEKKIKKLIKLLKEYKISLISDVVTGKIKVT
jgi:type I restriction enzyme S subunit